MLVQLTIFGCRKQILARKQRGTHHYNERGKDPADATNIEIPEAKSSVIQLLENQAGDQKAGDNEKDVDSDKASRQQVFRSVIEDHGKDCDGAQSIDVRPVGRADFKFGWLKTGI